MAHIHEIKDAETHFIIDATTREISNAGTLPALGQKDHNSEIFTFVAPRYVDNHDLSICNKVRVHYLNIESDTRKVYADIYEVADLHIDEADTTKVVFTWLISNYSTQLAGLLNFAIEFSCEKDGVIDYSWNTAIFTGIVVKKGINNAAQIITEYTDILEKWKQDVIKELTQNVNSHDHDNKNTLDAFGCQALDNPITDGDFNFGINTEDWHRLKFQGDTILMASDGAVVRNVEVKEDDNGNKFFRMYFNKPGLDTGLVPFISAVDIPISGAKDKVDIGLNGSGLELELPTGNNEEFINREEFDDFSINTDNRISFNTTLGETALKVYNKTSKTMETIDPIGYYDFGEVESLTLDFFIYEDLKPYRNEFAFTFISGATPTVLTLPSSVQWANELTIEANKRYEISIVDNIGLWCAVDLAVTE